MKLKQSQAKHTRKWFSERTRVLLPDVSRPGGDSYWSDRMSSEKDDERWLFGFLSLNIK